MALKITQSSAQIIFEQLHFDRYNGKIEQRRVEIIMLQNAVVQEYWRYLQAFQEGRVSLTTGIGPQYI